jgi:uncharacterized membrane protein YeiB
MKVSFAQSRRPQKMTGTEYAKQLIEHRRLLHWVFITSFFGGWGLMAFVNSGDVARLIGWGDVGALGYCAVLTLLVYGLYKARYSVMTPMIGFDGRPNYGPQGEGAGITVFGIILCAVSVFMALGWIKYFQAGHPEALWRIIYILPAGVFYATLPK